MCVCVCAKASHKLRGLCDKEEHEDETLRPSQTLLYNTSHDKMLLCISFVRLNVYAAQINVTEYEKILCEEEQRGRVTCSHLIWCLRYSFYQAMSLLNNMAKEH